MSVPPGGAGRAHVVKAAGWVTDKVASSYSSEWLRAMPNGLYSTLEDFRRCDPAAKRIAVIGCTGAGKSTLLNVLGGWSYVQRPPNYEFTWEDSCGVGPARPPFVAGAGTGSLTRKTGFASLFWFADEDRPFVAIDTPGHDDSSAADVSQPESRERLGVLAADLHHKLKALGHIHMILVLHNDVLSNRLNPATYMLLRMVDEKFAAAEQNVWGNVVVAYTKCNQHDTSWRSSLREKKRDLRESIKARIPGCNIDIPVLCLGGASRATENVGTPGCPPGSPFRTPRKGAIGDEIKDRRRSRSRTPKRFSTGSPCSARREADLSQTAASGDFEVLWGLLQDAQPLDTSRLQPFCGPDVRWQRLVQERDKAEARAKAALIYGGVICRLTMLLVFFFVRAWLLPEVVSRWCLLNLSGPLDEVLFLLMLAYWIGPSDVLHSCRHFLAVWISPWFRAVLGG